MDFSARLAGLKILARFGKTGRGFLARAELRPGVYPSQCNRQEAGLKFQPRMKFAMKSGP